MRSEMGSRGEVDAARWEIIRAANKHKVSIRRFFPPVMFGMRQIQQAVFVARQNRLVSGDVLRRAGFRAK